MADDDLFEILKRSILFTSNCVVKYYTHEVYHISSRFSSISEDLASELPENL